MHGSHDETATPSITWITAPFSLSRSSKMSAEQRRAVRGTFAALTLFQVSSGSRKLLLIAALLVLLVGVNCAADEKTVKPSPVSASQSSSASLSTTHRDEIYIDDESVDGSGGRGGLHDDLEKDPDYSGSGFGPDDEDSSTDLQQPHRGINSHTQSGKHNTNGNNNDDNDDLITSRTHHQTNSGTIIGSNSGSNSGIIGSNSGSNTGLNTIGGTTHTDDEDFDLGEGDDHEKHLDGGGLFAGSGDGGFIDHDDDDDHTGDVDEDDGGEGLIERPHQRQHEVDAAAGGSKSSSLPVDSSSTSSTSSSTTSSSSSDTNDRKRIVNANVDEDEDHEEDAVEEDDEFDETYDEDTKGDADDEDDHDKDDNTEMYIDGTEPNTKEDNERGNTNQGNTIHELDTNNVNSLPTDTKVIEHTTGNEVLIMNTSDDDRTASFFAQPGILAAVIGGAVVGLLCAILVVMFIVYRMRKKDEGSYALDEPKRSPAVNSYAKNANNREFYA